MNARIVVRVIFTVFLAAPVLAQTATDHSAHHPNPVAKPVAADATDAEVRKVDKTAGKVTLQHGEIRNLEMPAMTMVFRVKDPRMLDSLKEGDKVRFTADKVNGVYTVTAVEVVK